MGLNAKGLLRNTYVIGAAMGHATLDMARAATRLPFTGLAANAPVLLYGFSEGMCPVSEDCSARTLALPFHARLPRDDQERVVEALAAVLA